MIAIYSGVRYFAIQSENKAFAKMEAGYLKYRQTLSDKGPVEAFQASQTDFQQIMEDHAGSKGGKLARVLFAGMCYDAGDFDQAITLYLKALDDFAQTVSLRDFILSGLGYAFEGKKDYPEAAKYFEQIVASPDSIMKDEALFHLGQIYAAMGNSEKSKQSYHQIISDYSGSVYYTIAKGRLSG
jgi:tetratricopeptide (TPR) repeat protein